MGARTSGSESWAGARSNVPSWRVVGAVGEQSVSRGIERPTWLLPTFLFVGGIVDVEVRERRAKVLSLFYRSLARLASFHSAAASAVA